MLYREKIREAYETIEPTYAQKEKMLENIFTAAEQKSPAGKDVTMKRFKRKPMLIAATLILAILMVGCAAAVVMQFSDFEIAKDVQEEKAWFNGRGEFVPAQTVARTVISLQGIQGSKNQLAAKEWYAYEEQYVAEHADKIPNDFRAPREYDAYFIGNQEMMHKLDEIAEKYGLKLAGQGEIVQTWQSDILHTALGIDSLLLEQAPIEFVDNETGIFYACGNFRIHATCKITDPNFQWDRVVLMQMDYRDKAYMDTITVNIKEETVEEQWIQTLEDGTEVLVFLFGDNDIGHHAYIFCDREDAFITVRLNRSFFDGDGLVDTMGKADVERFVNMIDFGIKPQKPDMTEAVKLLDAADQTYQAAVEAKMAALGDPFHKDSYRELAEGLNMKTYALTDLNGDGVEECLLKGDHDNSALYTMKDGKTEYLLDGGGVLYLCENHIVERYEVIGEEYYRMHTYYRMDCNGIVQMERIVYDRANDRWGRSLDNDHVCEESLTKEQAESIIGSYIRMDVEMKPVSELQ